MRTERALGVSEYPVADLEGRDATADRLHFSRKLIPEDGHPWPDEPRQESHDEGLGRPVMAVRLIHGCRVNLDEQLVVLGRRLVHL